MIKYKHVLATVVLLLLLTVLLSFSANKYYTMERQACFGLLREYAEDVGRDIGRTYDSDRVRLEQLAVLFSREDLTNQETVDTMLDAMGCTELISNLELLPPEGENGTDVPGRIAAPVMQNGRIAAFISGEIDLSEIFRWYFSEESWDGMQMYAVEGTSGKLLQESWHKNLENIADLGQWQTGKGYSWEQFAEALKAGKTAATVLRTNDAGESVYTYAAPAGVADWMVVVSVPERELFAQAREMMGIFFGMGALLLTSFSFYFLWILWSIRREKNASEEQLRNVSYILEVEKELFDAHLRPEHFISALKNIADYLTAEQTFFWLADGFPAIKRRLWCSCNNHLEEAALEASLSFSEMNSILQESGQFLSYDANRLGESLPEGWKIACDSRIYSLMLISVAGLDGNQAMVIGACNMRRRWKHTGPLEQVSLSISRAISHYDSHLAITRLGQVDSLTGLMNRNSYHAALETLSNMRYNSIGCVYIDVNGLHELNNHLGHNAGDEMLKAVADELKHAFFESDIFRIGGDEFVVLCRDYTEQEVQKKAKQARKSLRKQDYEISVGIAWQDRQGNITEMIDGAEAAMQEDKRRYYQNSDSDRRMRALDLRLEQTLMEKDDADTFLSVLAPEFRGVYFVDLGSDTTRHLYIPEYFEEFLRESNDIYSKALLLYAQNRAKPDYISFFEQLCDYEKLEKQLDTGETPEFVYEKLNGEWLRLRILKLKSYTAEHKETLWIFTDTKRPEQKAADDV